MGDGYVPNLLNFVWDYVAMSTKIKLESGVIYLFVHSTGIIPKLAQGVANVSFPTRWVDFRAVDQIWG